jgi:UPF0716 protein FxsA
MCLVLLLLVLVPVVEIAVFFQVASMIGVLDALGVLLVFSIGGLLLVRHEGMGTMAKMRAELNEGRVPTAQLADGFWLLVAGLLLLVPGFVTDIAGLLLLLPPVRWLAKRWSGRRFGSSPSASVIRVQGTRQDGWQVDEWGPGGWQSPGSAGGSGGARGGEVIEAEGHEHEDPPELLP